MIAGFAVSLLHQAGVPENVLKLLPGTGAEVGNALTNNPVVDGVCFTGSTATAQHINRAMAKNLSPHAPLIAETGGLNAMIVDSTALPEQAVRDILASAFQSAGQRCSALRVLYLQEDIAEGLLKMLYGAMDELSVGDPRDFATDVGPIIDSSAAGKIRDYVFLAQKDGRLLKQVSAPDRDTFFAPAVIKVGGIEDIEEEIFGPVLHVATYGSNDLDNVIDAINAKGYGLTFGLHSRIDDRVQHIIDRVTAGNIYINRNQIGAVVGSQPFGGEGLSGTGPKAGGPRYLDRFVEGDVRYEKNMEGLLVSVVAIEAAFAALEPKISGVEGPTEMPGPTGESNRYLTRPRQRVLCLGPGAEMAEEQVERARTLGCQALAVAPGVKQGLNGTVTPEVLTQIAPLDAVVSWSVDAMSVRQTLAERSGPIVPLIAQQNFERWLITEQHICIDTTAAGGNAEILGS